MNNDNWQSLSVESYKKIFKNSPIKRTKYEGLKRNIKLNTNIKNNKI